MLPLSHTHSVSLSVSLPVALSALYPLLLYLLLSLAHTEIAQRFASVFNCCQWVNKWPGTLFKRGQLTAGGGSTWSAEWGGGGVGGQLGSRGSWCQLRLNRRCSKSARSATVTKAIVPVSSHRWRYSQVW